MENVKDLQSEETNLKREMGLFSSANVLIGIMVGSGIFYLGSFVLMRCGMSIGLALLVWIIGGIVTLLSGLCYAELGAMMPKAGGIYVYLRESFGEKTAFTAGVSTFILGSCGSTAAIAIAFVTVFNSFDAINFSTWAIKGIAIIAVIALTIVNVFGVKKGSIVQNIFTVGKLLPIILILFAGIFFGNESPSLSLAPTDGTEISFISVIGMIGFATVATLWAYEGWTNLNVISEEIKKPKRNIPRAIIVSILGVTVLYTLFNLAIYRVVPMDTINSMISSENWYLGTEAAKILFGSTGATLVSVCMVIAIFGALNGCVLVFPRTCLAIARDGVLPKKCAEVHPKYKTPIIALIIHAIISIILICTRDLGQITALVTFTAMAFNTLAFVSVLKLRKKYPDMERPYRVPTWIVYVTIAIMIALMINTVWEDPITSLISVAVPIVTFGVYVLLKKRQGNEELPKTDSSVQ